jgi:HJR/Mrr/RecB family endonuclease
MRKNLSKIISIKNDVNIYFLKEEIQMANRYIDNHSLLLAIRETQIKNTMNYLFPPVTESIIKTKTNKQW